MISIREYRKAESLEEAWQLNQKRGNRILGGMLWIKMGRGSIQTAIDLSGLGLDTIEENEEEFIIGSMVTLRQLETHRGFQKYTEGAVKEALRHIVGVQFRNSATVGGSLFGRYGFSDVLTLLLAMDTKVELYRGGMVPLEDFARMPYDRDILVRVFVKKILARYYYQSVRNTETDFPVLTCCAALLKNGMRFSVGARPGKAMRVEIQEDWFGKVKGQKTQEEGSEAAFSWKERAEELGLYVAERIPMGSNMRGSAEYRRKLIQTLAARAAEHFGNA